MLQLRGLNGYARLFGLTGRGPNGAYGALYSARLSEGGG